MDMYLRSKRDSVKMSVGDLAETVQLTLNDASSSRSDAMDTGCKNFSLDKSLGSIIGIKSTFQGRSMESAV